MDVKVLLFARSRELAGTREAVVSLPAGGTTTQLVSLLLQQVGAQHWVEHRAKLSFMR